MHEPDPTPLDLRWTMFGVPIRVHPMFWVLAAVLGWGNLRFGFVIMFLWMACVFISVLVHEFGHVLMGRLFGSDGRILLYAFGGLAIGSNDVRRRWQRILVLLAGPGAELLIALPILLYFRTHDLPGGLFLRPSLLLILEFMLWVNLLWGLFNLLPIYPLDGGQITRELFEAIWPSRGGMVALGLSTLVAAGIALLIFLTTQYKALEIRYMPTGLYNALIFASFAATSIQAMQAEYARSRWDERLPWER
jgi:Zn-dependent protease